MVYSTDKDIESIIGKNDWSGEVKRPDGDFLMWVDANLAALKTDHAMVRKLNYSFAPTDDGQYLATASMTYTHNGGFDWRTTRYRTYARIYVPQGSKLVSSEGSINWSDTDKPGEIDSGVELGKHWFGQGWSQNFQ